MTLTDLEIIENAESIVVSEMDNVIVEIILVDGTETGGIVESHSEDLTKIDIVNGAGEYFSISFDNIKKVYRT